MAVAITCTSLGHKTNLSECPPVSASPSDFFAKCMMPESTIAHLICHCSNFFTTFHAFLSVNLVEHPQILVVMVQDPEHWLSGSGALFFMSGAK